jgi:pyruvate/2-oxoglutarate dehydrogenase complex dihydrolipoamide acyltransferase (E2) component
VLIVLLLLVTFHPCLQDIFFEKHGVKLGFMSAFVKAAASALQEVPAVNAVIDGNEIIYRWGVRCRHVPL